MITATYRARLRRACYQILVAGFSGIILELSRMCARIASSLLRRTGSRVRRTCYEVLVAGACYDVLVAHAFDLAVCLALSFYAVRLNAARASFRPALKFHRFAVTARGDC